MLAAIWFRGIACHFRFQCYMPLLLRILTIIRYAMIQNRADATRRHYVWRQRSCFRFPLFVAWLRFATTPLFIAARCFLLLWCYAALLLSLPSPCWYCFLMLIRFAIFFHAADYLHYYAMPSFSLISSRFFAFDTFAIDAFDLRRYRDTVYAAAIYLLRDTMPLILRHTLPIRYDFRYAFSPPPFAFFFRFSAAPPLFFAWWLLRCAAMRRCRLIFCVICCIISFHAAIIMLCCLPIMMLRMLRYFYVLLFAWFFFYGLRMRRAPVASATF